MQARNGEGVVSAPPPGPAEKLLGEWSELDALGVDWVKKWLVLRERLIEIAKVLRRLPWVVEVVRRRPMSNLTPTWWRHMLQETALRCVSRSPRRRLFAHGTAR